MTREVSDELIAWSVAHQVFAQCPWWQAPIWWWLNRRAFERWCKSEKEE